MSAILTEEFKTVQQSRLFADMHHFRGNRPYMYIDTAGPYLSWDQSTGL